MPGRRGGRNNGGAWKNVKSQVQNPYATKEGPKKAASGAGNPDQICDVFSLLLEKYSRFQHGILDCGKLEELEEIKKYNPNLNAALWCKVITMAVKKVKGCKALSLDGNNVKVLYHLAESLSDGVVLDSLSLQHNQISNIEDIQKLRPLKLRHLLLRGNPLYKGDKTALLAKIKQHLPTLERIDGLEIARSTVVDHIPLEYVGINESDPSQASIKEFIAAYFTMSQSCSGPDKSVDSMLDFYDNKAALSFTLQPKLAMASSGHGLALFQKLNQNQHNVILNPNAPTTFQGKLNVGKCLEILHMASITYDSSSILCNTEITPVPPEVLQSAQLPCPHLFSVVMHGKLTFAFPGKGKETTNYDKYFDRTWLVMPKSGSAVIVNDVLHLRDIKEEKDAVYRKAKSKAYYGLHLYSDDMKVIQLASETGLSLAAARSCLELDEAGPWDLEKARACIQAKLAENVLNQSHFVHERDAQKLSLERFSELTNLTADMAYKCLQLPEVNFDLWRGWELFLHKQAILTPDMFKTPPS
eukprot:TRINITY_DN15143_c1_g1_i1.p1 TRINITY_DN15143_c1_g1~~TRINITY_DN15143_c1_g1_i1.p1  ORF type:complete len:528 (+),score=193.11 TRINITY_DN15143_c1_g1_i1:71-1654(+)